tara:strand:+ start:2554 stop:3339 length:786 start_codon:yes stop_codon:yes gene_type:complete
MSKTLAKNILTSERSDNNRILLTFEELQKENSEIYEKLLNTHALSIMSPGSIMYGPGLTLTMLATEEEKSLPKYFAWVWPFERINVNELGLLPVTTDYALGERAYVGAMGMILQHISSAQAHATCTMNASTMRLTNIDTSIFKDKEGNLRINTNKDLLKGKRPLEAKMAIVGKLTDTGNWLSRISFLSSTTYIFGTLQNYLQFGIDVNLEDILKVIHMLKKQLKLSDNDITPGVMPQNTYGSLIDWREALIRAPLLRGIRY